VTDYEKLGKELGKLVADKQLAYGDSFGKSGNVLRELYPNGISIEQYDDVLTIARIVDKLFRIATQKDAYGESPYKDAAGYCLLAMGKYKEEPLQPSPLTEEEKEYLKEIEKEDKK
jgi:hypothetical protein